MNNGKVFRNAWKSYHRHGVIAKYSDSSYIPRKFVNKSLNDLMPRDKLQLQQMQQQRENIKLRSKSYNASKVSLQILGTGARGAPTALYVSTDHTKYLFNCGEGTQRLAFEHRLRLSKLEHIFLTSPTWKNLGGLPGMALTVQENGVPNIKIHGPRGTSDIFKAVERFVVLKDLDVSDAECHEDEPFVDQAMTIRYVHLARKKGDSSSESESEPLPAVTHLDDVDYYASEANANGKRSSSHEKNPRKIAKLETLNKGGRINGSVAYVCKLHAKPGTLLLDKCVDMGVKPGPMLGELKAGNDITLPDGTIVLSSDVCSPMDPGPVFIVIECPNEYYLDSLINSQAFVKHQASSVDPDELANCVVHFTPEDVLNNTRYREWMKKFPTSTRHMIINEENRCTGSEAIHRIQHKLHLLHPTIFPLLDTEGINVDERGTSVINDGQDEEAEETKLKNDESKTTEQEFPLINRVKTLDSVHLRPLHGFDKSGEIVITPRAYIDETFAVEGFLDSLAELQTEINARTRDHNDKDEYPKILMLGTGSCIPNKTRNTSGILLRLDEERSIILDCGEGTAGQLVRFYGRTKVDKILSTIKAIYVSHLHADHHIGLIGLLKERDRATNEPVLLLAPEHMSPWLRVYHRRFEPIVKKYRLVPNKDMVENERKLSVSTEMILNKLLPGVKINTVRVKHCPHAFGVSITSEKGCKIVYSGDTMPCDALVELGADCDLLIHEATMEDDLESDAIMKLHSTTSQAIGVGERMRAKFILLTHFSQRYSKIPHLPDNGETGPNLSRVGIAYDMMDVSVSQLNLLPLLYPSLKLMFSEFCNLLEEKLHKRQMRSEREARGRVKMAGK